MRALYKLLSSHVMCEWVSHVSGKRTPKTKHIYTYSQIAGEEWPLIWRISCLRKKCMCEHFVNPERVTRGNGVENGGEKKGDKRGFWWIIEKWFCCDFFTFLFLAPFWRLKKCWILLNARTMVSKHFGLWLSHDHAVICCSAICFTWNEIKLNTMY